MSNPMAKLAKVIPSKSSTVSKWPYIATLITLALPANATSPLSYMPEKLWADFSAQCLAPMEAGQQPDFGGKAADNRRMQDDGANYTDSFSLDSGIVCIVDRAITSGIIWGCACAARDDSGVAYKEAKQALSQRIEAGRYDLVVREGRVTGGTEPNSYHLLRSSNWRPAALEVFVAEMPEIGLWFRVEDVDLGYRTETFDLFSEYWKR